MIKLVWRNAIQVSPEANDCLYECPLSQMRKFKINRFLKNETKVNKLLKTKYKIRGNSALLLLVDLKLLNRSI